eukprot:COSAG01_NODE_3808_length_5677_cov_7.172643_2_plen_139_part_00
MKKDLESDPATLAMIAEMRAGLDASVPDYLKGAPSHENSASDATTKVLDTRRLQELDTVFKSFDKDGNGMIDADELRELTIALGGPMDAAACETNAEHCLSAPAQHCGAPSTVLALRTAASGMDATTAAAPMTGVLGT